jgi:predicted ribosomally synthesized peptide with nif11-like leader
MSVMAAMKFLERVEREETLRTQLYISRADDLERLVKFAHGKGFILTEDELREALKNYKPKLPTANIEPLKQLAAKNN